LEENLAEKDVILVRRQTSLQNLSEEFLKGNEIIKTLQKDIATLKSKVCVEYNWKINVYIKLNSKFRNL
jgi:hypothetical protein